MKSVNLADERKDYRRGQLLEADTPAEPFALFHAWMEDALAHADEATAMALATCKDNRPSCRIVLLKGSDDGVFIFYTHYGSRKGHDLAANPHAAATFYWSKLERQVRIEGTIRKTSREQADAYFHSRPRESQISASISPQSQLVPNRATLEHLWALREEQLHGSNPPLPEDWGGYELVPYHIEFWQGGAGRLHDRIVYEREGQSWKKVRLAP